MSDTALTRPRDDLSGRSATGAVHALCAWAATEMGVHEPLPVLHPLATGDQLEVVGREFLDWAESGRGEPDVERWRAELDRVRRVV
jgi:hypothetical protein